MKDHLKSQRAFAKSELKESAETLTTTHNETRKFNKMTESLKRSLIRLIVDKNCSIKKVFPSFIQAG